MNVNSVSNVSCKAGKIPSKEIKQMVVPLKEDMKGLLKVSGDTLEYTVSRAEKEGSGIVHMSRQYGDSSSKTFWRLFERIQKDVKEGFDFWENFRKAIFS